MISLYSKHAGLSSEAMIVSTAVAARSGMLHTLSPGFCTAIVPPRISRAGCRALQRAGHPGIWMAPFTCSCLQD